MEIIPSLWVEKYKILNEAGLPIEFHSHKFLRDIYDDMSPFQVVLKPPQVGMTVLQIIKTLWCAKKKNWDIIYCVDTETEALSKRGFLKYNELTLEDELLTLDLNGDSQWSKVLEVFSNNVVTDMYEYKARNFDAFVTKNHRWIIHNAKRKYEIRESNKLQTHHKFIPKTVLNDIGGVKSLEDDYVRLLSWIFSEGSYQRQKGKHGKEKGWTICITQSEKVNIDKCAEIRRVLLSNGIKPKEYRQTNYKVSGCIDFKFAYQIAKDIRTRFPNKRPDARFAMSLTREQSKIFIDTFVSADGWTDKSGTKAITQKDKQTVDILNMIGVLAGYAVSVVKPSVNGCYTVRFTQFPVIYTGELNPKIIKDWKGKIWCPRTSVGTFYARRNGRCYWTGNTLPTATDVNDMAGGKINRIIAQNPVLSSWVKDHDTVEQKAVGKQIIYYRSTFVAKAAMMVSSDLNVHDEVDASDASVITQYETRLEAKSDGKRWYFSHPSIAGFGVDIQWQQSDKKEWYIICPHCQYEHFMEYPNCIKGEDYVCAKCQGVLTDEDRINGQWKPTTQGKFSGYHISQMMCSWISAKNIVEKANDPKKDKQYFCNYVLGLPFVGSENKIEPEVVLKNVVPEVNPQTERIVIGVDTGLPIHFTCMNKDGVFHYGKCKPPSKDYDPYKELESMLIRWPRSIMVADQGGDLVGIRRLQDKYIGRVFLCYYRKDKKGKEIITWGEDDNLGIVTVDRNRMITLIVEQMRDIGLIRLNGVREDWLEFASHFGNIYRELVITKESTGKDFHTLYGSEFVWKRTGGDHFVHTLLYALVGMDRFAKGLVEIIKNDGFLKGLPTGSRADGVIIGRRLGVKVDF